MADFIKIDTKGDKELQEYFRRLPPHISRKLVISAARKSARPVVRDAKANLRASWGERSGNLQKSIGTRALPQSSNPQGAIAAGVLIGKGKKGYHAHLLEKGVKPGKRKGKFVFRATRDSGSKRAGDIIVLREIDHPGIKAKPFVRPAIENNRNKVEETFSSSMSKAMLDLAKRTLKKLA